MAIAGKRIILRAACAILASAVLFALALFLYRHNPADARYFPRCVFYSLTGYYCPGCGTGRAMHFLLHGEIARAFKMNAFAVLMIPVMVWLMLRPRWAYRRATPVMLIVVIVAYWILRNIPAFGVLAPH